MITEDEMLAVALRGYEAQLSVIEQRISEIKAKVDNQPKLPLVSDSFPHIFGPPQPAASREPAKRQYKIGLEARKRIGEAQRKRWAEFHRQKAAVAEAEQAKQPAGQKAKRKYVRSAAARRRMSIAQKKRYAASRKAKTGKRGFSYQKQGD